MLLGISPPLVMRPSQQHGGDDGGGLPNRDVMSLNTAGRGEEAGTGAGGLGDVVVLDIITGAAVGS